MSLEHILLGMLRKPRSGYDLRQEFEMGAKHFWSAELSQIYPVLKRMQGRGWLESRLEPSPKGPDRRVYERTKAGQEVLHEWLRAGPVVGTNRLAYIGQLLFMGELKDLDATLEFIHQLREEFDAVLTLLSGAAEEIQSMDQPLSLDEFHDLLGLELGVSALQARVAWCDKSIAMIRKRMKQTKRKKS